jgi:hypothetical protein
MMPHEFQKLCWQTAMTMRLRTAGKSLLLLISRAISARLWNLRTSASARPVANVAAVAPVMPIDVCSLKRRETHRNPTMAILRLLG